MGGLLTLPALLSCRGSGAESRDGAEGSKGVTSVLGAPRPLGDRGFH